ncbi:MAG: ATP-binding cassette domain-containing protein [Desulfovibrionaceae bacterium]
MKELYRRLRLRPALTTEILVATLFVNVLFLASPIYTIQILSRYIPYGFDGTLITLTCGMLAALALMFFFGVIRTRLASAVSSEPDRLLAAQTMEVLTRARGQALARIPPAKVQEYMSGPQTVQAAFDGQRICSVVDMPFSVLFLLAVLFLSRLLAMLTFACIVFIVLNGVWSMRKARKGEMESRDENTSHRGLVASAIAGSDTVRAFLGAGFVRRAWEEQGHRLAALRRRLGDERSVTQNLLAGVANLLRVAVYAVGAKEVVMGELTVGTLIGASILSSKAMASASSFMQSFLLMRQAEDVLGQLREFFSLPLESPSGAALRHFSGRLEFHDVGFGYPGMTGPLFESMTFTLEPGDVCWVDGLNGSGKTTLAKLVVGLAEPARGGILADGVDIRQFAPEWWRRQILYMPQEPVFLNASILENITLSAPGVDGERLNAVVRAAGLRRFLDNSPRGLETPVVEGGRNLPVGVRRRLGLARALMNPGHVAVFDEPTEGLDAEGVAAVHGVMGMLLRQKVTVLMATTDPALVALANRRLDLNSKPVPGFGLGPRRGAVQPQGPVLSEATE